MDDCDGERMGPYSMKVAACGVCQRCLTEKLAAAEDAKAKAERERDEAQLATNEWRRRACEWAEAARQEEREKQAEIAEGLRGELAEVKSCPTCKSVRADELSKDFIASCQIGKPRLPPWAVRVHDYESVSAESNGRVDQILKLEADLDTARTALAKAEQAERYLRAELLEVMSQQAEAVSVNESNRARWAQDLEIAGRPLGICPANGQEIAAHVEMLIESHRTALAASEAGLLTLSQAAESKLVHNVCRGLDAQSTCSYRGASDVDSFAVSPDQCEMVRRARGAGQRLLADHQREIEAARAEAAKFSELAAELKRARAKFPRNRRLLTALTEELGELAKALLQRDPNWKTEALQCAAVAMRIYEEGDADFDDVTDEEAQP